GLVVEDTAANVRPIIQETSRLPQSYSIAVGAKRKKCTSTAGRVSRSAMLSISAFRAKFRLARHLVIGSQGRQRFRMIVRSKDLPALLRQVERAVDRPTGQCGREPDVRYRAARVCHASRRCGS